MAAPQFKLSGDGVSIEAGEMGFFQIKGPILSVSDASDEHALIEKVRDDLLRLKYGSGLVLELALKGGKLNGHYTGGTPAVKNLKFSFIIPMKFNGKGKYAFDGSSPVAFPDDPGEVHILHGGFRTFSLIDPLERGFTLLTPGGYQGIQDNRPQNWGNFFVYHYQYDIGGNAEGYLQFILDAYTDSQASEATAPAKKFLADRYGQSGLIDFPGKVKGEEELLKDAEEQRAELAAVEGNGKLDAFGGLKGTGERYGLKATGYFHVGKADNRQVLVTPEGNMFFQLGVCGIANTDDFTKVQGREKDFEWLPAKNDAMFLNAWRSLKPNWGDFSFYVANWIKKFGKPYDYEEWTGQVVDRLRLWGFNSAGAFTSYSNIMREKAFPYVQILPVSNNNSGLAMLPDKFGAGYLFDPFAAGVEEKLDQLLQKSLVPSAEDPLLIGYFTGNEQHFELLPGLLPRYKASQVAAKARLVDFLKAKYSSDEAFNKAWEPAEPISSLDQLGEMSLFVRSDKSSKDMREFFSIFLEKYYALVETSFRKHDPNHLLIGSRWTPGTSRSREVVEAGGRHLDVLSVNYYTYRIDDAFLKQVHEWGGKKPIILSEWYYSTDKRGLTAHKEVETEKDRGFAYRNYIEQSAELPFVVGSQWFIYTDQAITGRFFEGFNGEGNNTGFVDVVDRPYKELVEAARMTNNRIYDVMVGSVEAFAFQDPRFSGEGVGDGKRVQVPRALQGIQVDATTGNWPMRPAEPIESARVTQGVADPGFLGDFKLCWSEEKLFFLIQVKDPSPLKNTHEGGGIWQGDAVELFIGGKDIDQAGPLGYSDRQVLIRATEQPQLFIAGNTNKETGSNAALARNAAGDGYILEVGLTWSDLGIEPTAGLELLFDVAIDNSEDGLKRKQQLMWSGDGTNSKDRGVWGRAKLVNN